MRRFFNPESDIWRLLGHFGDLVTLSLLWVLFSVPIVTAGPASAALYDCTVHCLRRKEVDLPGRFWSTFKAELKLGALSTLLWIALLALPAYLLLRALRSSGTVAAAALVLLLFLLLCVLCWVFPTLSRFTLGFVSLNSTSLRLALGHILRSAALALILLLSVFLCARFFIPLFFQPCLGAFLSSFLIEPVFERYEDD